MNNFIETSWNERGFVYKRSAVGFDYVHVVKCKCDNISRPILFSYDNVKHRTLGLSESDLIFFIDKIKKWKEEFKK